MKRNSIIFKIPMMFAVLVGVGIFATTALAEGENEESQKWQFEVTPYLFAAGLNGTVGIRGVSAENDMSFSDILERLDRAFMLSFSAMKGKWIFAFDGMYFKLADQKAASWQGLLGNTNTAQLNVGVTQEIFGLAVGRRVMDDRAKVDIAVLARYTNLDAELKLAITTGASLLPDGSRSVGRKDKWWDIAIAGRAVYPFAENWDVRGYADIGAGGSDFTCQFFAGINWQFSRPVNAKIGYRYFYQDYSKDSFSWAMATHGPYAGIGIRF